MKNLKSVFKMSKEYKEQLTLNDEKVTIVNNRQIYIQNYRELIEITDQEIMLSNLKITGRDLKIAKISKYFIEIKGQIHSVTYVGGN